VGEPDFAGTEVSGAPRGGGNPSAAGLLSGRQLLVLHLLGRRYARAHRGLPGLTHAAALEVERSVHAALGAATADEAVERARRRLIL
jgi:hypothetical protein